MIQMAYLTYSIGTHWRVYLLAFKQIDLNKAFPIHTAFLYKVPSKSNGIMSWGLRSNNGYDMKSSELQLLFDAMYISMR